MDNEELELLDGFRRLRPAGRSMLMTAVSMAVSDEEAMLLEYERLLSKYSNHSTKKCPSNGDKSLKNKK